MKIDLVSLLPEELAALVKPIGEPPFRGRQLFQWVQARRATGFEAMTDLPKGLRGWLAEHCDVSTLSPASVLDSVDGSRKLLFGATPEDRFYAVLMPSEDRVSLCISSQVGCRMGCRFCLTGAGGFRRNLTAAEMVGQVLAANRLLNAAGPGWVDPAGNVRESRVTNVVFMGMGERLDNQDEVIRAVRIISHREGLRVAPRRTTVSTVGLVGPLRMLVEANTGASIAISLPATTDAARSAVVPIGRRHGIEELISTLADLPLAHGHHFTIEYQLIRGVGDSVEDAARLSRLLARFPSKVNLIPFNPWPGCGFDRPDPAAIEAFRSAIERKNHTVTVRYSRGADIGAACGMLGESSSGPSS